MSLERIRPANMEGSEPMAMKIGLTIGESMAPITGAVQIKPTVGTMSALVASIPSLKFLPKPKRLLRHLSIAPKSRKKAIIYTISWLTSTLTSSCGC